MIPVELNEMGMARERAHQARTDQTLAGLPDVAPTRGSRRQDALGGGCLLRSAAVEGPPTATRGTADVLAAAGIVAAKAAPDTTPAAAPAPAIGDTGVGAAANVETRKINVHPHPTVSEAVLDAARAVDGWANHG